MTDVLAGRYAIEQLAASGGMATLYRSRDLRSGASVAIKVLHGPSAQTPRATARFLREAKTLDALEHPAIVRYLDHGTDERGRPFLVMQWLDGESLDIVLRQRGLPPEEALVVARRMVSALAYCHARGIVHRDVKPSNIVLVGGKAEGAMLVDFGIAMGTESRTRATETGTVLGTPRYMSPEQLRSARKVDGRADVFGLGCALYESLTGRHPFGGDDVYAYATRLAEGEAAPAIEARPELPEVVSALVAKMIAREAASRFAADDALLAQIDEAERAARTLSLEPIVVSPPSSYESELAAMSPSVGTMATYAGDELAPAARGPIEPEVRGPTPVGRFIDRPRERAELVARLGARGTVAVLWGAPGIGKSRLALEVCHALVRARAAGGGPTGFVVDLRAARDRADVVRAVCAVLLSGAQSAFVAEGDIASVGRMLRAWGDPVIVLDGADQVMSEVAEIASAWSNARVGATVMVTTRGRMRVPGAVEIELGPLAASGAEEGTLGPGVELLLAAANTNAETLDEAERGAAVQIVEALDGNPLALELAAARVPVLGLKGLVERLEEPLAVLGETSGAGALSMRDALEWSYRLLSPAEQRALAECAVFRGPFTVRAAEAVLTKDGRVGAIDLLGALRQSSLVGEAPRGREARVVLARTVREFARGKLTSEELGAAERRRNAYLATWAWGLSEEIGRTGSAGALARLAEEAEQLLDVASGVLGGVGEIGVEDARVGVRAAVAIEPVVAMRGPLTRYIDLLSRGIAVIPPREELAGHARRVRGKHLGRRGAEDAARADLDEACAVADACGATDLKAAARLALGVLHQASRRLDEAAQIYESVLSMSHGGERLRTEAMALANLAAIAHDSRKFDEALGLYEESLSLFDALGDERLGAWMRVNSAVLLQERGDRGEARARYTRAAEALTKLDDDRLLGFALTNLGMLDIEENELDGALANLEKARGLLARAGDITIEVLTIGRLAAVLAMRGRVREALGAAVLAERMASRYGAVIRGPARVMRAFVDVAQARAARESGNLVAAESALMAARARIREVTTAPEGGGLAVSAISDEVRAALRVLQAWMPTA